MAEFHGLLSSFKPNTPAFKETASYSMDLGRHFPGFLHANATDHHSLISMSDSSSIFVQTIASDQFPGLLCDIGSRCMFASDPSLALNHRNPHHHPVDNTNAMVDAKSTTKKRESMAVSDTTSSVISSSIPVHGCGMEGIARTSETNVSCTVSSTSLGSSIKVLFVYCCYSAAPWTIDLIVSLRILLQICGGGKRRRNSKKQAEKLREVIHVRAKRGHATDNHSLAERVIQSFLDVSFIFILCQLAESLFYHIYISN